MVAGLDWQCDVCSHTLPVEHNSSSMNNNAEYPNQLIVKHGGYRKLKSFQLARSITVHKFNP